MLASSVIANPPLCGKTRPPGTAKSSSAAAAGVAPISQTASTSARGTRRRQVAIYLDGTSAARGSQASEQRGKLATMFPRLAAVLALVGSLAGSTASAAGGDVPPVVQTVRPARLVVPSIGVDAPIVEVGLKPDGAMDSPHGPDPVGWYSFSPTPG